MPTFEIICLANSTKLRGKCVAGLRTDGGGWIRPVASTNDGTLFKADYTLDNGTDVQILDLVVVEVSKARPQAHQPENWVIGNRRWKLLSRPASPSKIREMSRQVDPGPALFGDYRDRLDFGLLSENFALSSLCLIRPEKLQWQITTSYRGRRQTRAIFRLSDQFYNLAVTDPVWQERLSLLDPGIHKLEAANLEGNTDILLTISLGEPLPSDNQCYKLVAGVILLNRDQE